MVAPTVSIIIPVYNVIPYLDHCISSVINQTYHHLDIILVNDGSTDGSGERCNEWQKKDDRIHVINQNNQGLSATRNAGIDHCRGDFVFFLDSDDFLEKGAIERLVNQAKLDGSDIVIGSYYAYFEDRSTYGFFLDDGASQYSRVYTVEEWLDMARTNDYQIYICFVVAWGKLFRRHLFDSHVRFPHGFPCEDDLTTYKYYLLANQISFMNEAIMCYRQTKGSLVKQIDQHYQIGIEAATERLTLFSITNFDLTQIETVYRWRVEYAKENALAMGPMDDYNYYQAIADLIQELTT